jgi:peptidoglycan/xylan/chitin deacetylase (PgdA/CDA1 family)
MRRLLLLALLAPIPPLAAAESVHPLLVSIDDLPVAGGMHPDDASRRQVTEALLAVLRKHSVPAVGLVVWGQVRTSADQDLLDLWLAAGHELGSHSYQHPSYTDVTIDEYLVDAEKARAGLGAFLAQRGKELRFFRFPYLREGDTEEKVLAMRTWLDKTGQRNLPVTIDNQDWSHEERWVKASRAGEGRVLEELRQDYLASLRIAVRHAEGVSDKLFGRPVPGILLLHANAVGSANWDALFTWLESTGHRFAGVDEVLADPAFADPPVDVARRGYGLWDRIARARREREAREQVALLLRRQAEAWNGGDLEAFCSPYAADATYASTSGLTQGRQAILERYRVKYPDAASRGTLSLEILETRLSSGLESSVFGDAVPSRVHGVSVLARWTLARVGKPPATGLTLLVLRPRGEGWEILQDASL